VLFDIFPKSLLQAVKLFQQAATKNVAESQFSLAMHYKDGTGNGVLPSLQGWSIKHSSALTLHSYMTTTGVEQNLEECLRYLNLAADQGHVKALFNLGLIYERGQGSTEDLEKAMLCYTEAAAHGNCKAAVNLGVMYAEGRGCDPIASKAMKWFGVAAEKGDASAMFNLSLAYQIGNGVAK